MAKKATGAGSKAQSEGMTPAATLPEEKHPDYLAGRLSDADDPDAFTPVPGGPLPPFPPGPVPQPEPLPRPDPFPRPEPLPHPFPNSVPQPFPVPTPFPQLCSPVSGRYSHAVRLSGVPAPIPKIWPPRPSLLVLTVRVDVDRFFPQNRISIEARRLFPNIREHVIAEVVSDRCTALNRRIIEADITYRNGGSNLIPGTRVTFTARRTTGFGYDEYRLQLSGGGIHPRTFDLDFRSIYFDPFDIEVARVANAGTIVTAYDTSSHPTRPANLPNETVSLATVFKRAGFDATTAPNVTVVPTSGAGANGTWSDAEMHDAMETYWSKFANKPQWAMWVLYAARHDSGYGLGGIMFDDIGPNHRQGTAIFTDSFIQDVPSGDPDPAAWRDRMQFWTAIHEMGHGFNLAHSWQKALGVVHGAPGDPWIPLANEPEARSFMNYPFRVSGGQATFFSDFRFRFSDDELIFMRHAPRRFVQMGNSDWFVNHGFEAPEALTGPGNWRLEIRPNRETNAYRHLEPVTVEAKLTNVSRQDMQIDPDLLEDGRHISVFIQSHGAEKARPWRALITRCHAPHTESLAPGASIYGAQLIGVSTDGWLIDEPGFYKVQAAVDIDGEIVVSNVLRLYVGAPKSDAEAAIAPDYFTEDVGRAIAFAGAPSLEGANAVLERLVETCGDNPAAVHATVALSSPLMRDFKRLEAGSSPAELAIRTQPAKVDEAAKAQTEALLKQPTFAADTMAHIPYFGQLRRLASCMAANGDIEGAKDVLKQTVKAMESRNVLAEVIEDTEAERKAFD